jgi:hypothetical protein
LRHQINGPVSFEISEPIPVVSAWNEETYSEFIAVDDFYFVSTRLKAAIEAAGVDNVEFFPAYIENFDKEKSKTRAKVSGEDLTPGTAGGGQRHHDYWWMNIWVVEDIIDRNASVGRWVSGDAPFITRLLNGASGADILERDQDQRLQIVLAGAPKGSLFRVKGLPKPLFISRAFADVLEAAQIDVTVMAFDLERGI